MNGEDTPAASGGSPTRKAEAVLADLPPLTRTEHLPQRIAGQVEARIQQGDLRPGDKLPAEHAMARSFGVSRTVVREAIAQLRNEGLVETRQGIGAFVTQRSVRHIRLDDGQTMRRHEFRHLYQLRIPLEIEAAGLAAANRTPGHLTQLTDAFARMRSTDDWAGAGTEADLDFHRTLAAATGNDYFVQFLGAISDRISHAIEMARDHTALDTIIAATLVEHGTLYDAVVAGDPSEARAAMLRHMRGSAERIGLRLDDRNAD